MLFQAEDDDAEGQSVPVTVVQESSKGSPGLQKLLIHLHKMLQKSELFQHFFLNLALNMFFPHLIIFKRNVFSPDWTVFYFTVINC